MAGVERSLPHPIFFRGGATHYSDGEGSLTIHMVRDFSLDHKVRQGLDWPDFSLDQKGDGGGRAFVTSPYIL